MSFIHHYPIEHWQFAPLVKLSHLHTKDAKEIYLGIQSLIMLVQEEAITFRGMKTDPESNGTLNQAKTYYGKPSRNIRVDPVQIS